MTGRDREAKALAGFRVFAGRDPFQVCAQARLLDVGRELFQRRRRIDLPAHVVHAGLVGLAQHDTVVVVLVPSLQEDALLLLVTRHLG